jgi:hypothetical protein
MARRAGCLQKLIGIGIIIVGVAVWAALFVDNITIIGIVNDIIPLSIVLLGVSIAFPEVRLPKLKR